MNFLKEVAKHLYKKYGNEIADICVVFPNKRASLFFRQYLMDLSDQVIWSPSFANISDLMQEFSQLQLADPLVLNAELYRSFKKYQQTYETFDKFFFWGEVMLADFDDVDKYMVNAQDLFRNLEEIKSYNDMFDYLSPEQIKSIQQFWASFHPKSDSSHKKEFASIWEVLHPVYTDFRNKIREKGWAYEGMMYREVAESLQSGNHKDFSAKKYAFVGFNALNNCEKVLFDSLQKVGKAEFFWDYDEYYLNNDLHEAGFFLRQNIKDFPNDDFEIDRNQLRKGKQIEFIAVPSETGQTEVASQLVSKLDIEDSEWKRTAVVLAEENLLTSVSQHIPENVPQLNITMGYPFVETPLYQLFDALIKIDKAGKSKKAIYFKQLLAVLKNRYVQHKLGKYLKQFERLLLERNIAWVSEKYWEENEDMKLLFRRVNSAAEAGLKYSQIISWLTEVLLNDPEGRFVLDREYLWQFKRKLHSLHRSIDEIKLDIGQDVYLGLLLQLMQAMSIPFEGEPLEGMQVMGILETRCLDFDNLVVLSMNEGVLPKTAAAASLIPYNLRKGFGLLTIEHQDSIFAYYFYRLIQSAKHIHLVYNTTVSSGKSGEMSRFLMQLKYEKAFTITERVVNFSIAPLEPKAIEVKKTPEILKSLSEFKDGEENERFISPSALNLYIGCSLRYYFRYIARLSEPDMVYEDIEPFMFGNILHKAMEILYQEKKDDKEIITAEWLNELKKNKKTLEDAVHKAYEEEFAKTEVKEYRGGFVLIKDVIIQYIERILEIDAKLGSFKALGLEEQLYMPVKVKQGDEEFHVRVGGNVDRIDETDEAYRIIDYKTGKADLKFNSVEELTDVEKGNKAVFQTFLYARLFVKNGLHVDEHKPVKMGLYVTGDVFSKFFDWQTKLKVDARKTEKVENYFRYEAEFEEVLSNLMNEIYNPEIPFTQTEKTKNCLNCPYKQICHR